MLIWIYACVGVAYFLVSVYAIQWAAEHGRSLPLGMTRDRMFTCSALFATVWPVMLAGYLAYMATHRNGDGDSQ
jgi:hypothetical protein